MIENKEAKAENKEQKLEIPSGYQQRILEGNLKKQVSPEAKPEEKKTEPKPEEKKDEPKTIDQDKQEEQSKDEKKDAAAVEKKEEPKSEEKKSPAFDDEAAERLAKATAKATTEALSKMEQEREEKTKQEVDLTEEEQETIDLLGVLEKEMPSKYPKGTADKVRKIIAKIAEDGIDPESEEADALWEGVTIKDKDLAKAKEIRSESKYKARIEELDAKSKRLERKVTEITVTPTAIKSGSVLANSYASKFGDEFKDVVSSEGVVTKDAAERVLKSRPDDGEILLDAAQRVANFTRCAILEFNGVETELSKQIEDFSLSLEKHITSNPQLARDDKGRSFATIEAFSKMSASERQKHWILTPDIVSHQAANIIIDEAKKAAQSEIERASRVLKRHGVNVEQKKEAQVEAQKQEQTPSSTEKPSSPASVDAIHAGKPAAQPSGGYAARLFSGTIAR